MRPVLLCAVPALIAFHLSTASALTGVGFGGTGLNEGDPLTNEIPNLIFSGAILALEGGVTFAYNPGDEILSGEPAGGFFVTDALGAGDDPLDIPGPVEIAFSVPMQDVSFQILDLDGESVTAEAFDGSNVLLETIEAMWPGTGDLNRQALLFAFASSGIERLELTVIGLPELPERGGWGLDNLAYNIPEPSTSLLLGLGVAGLAVMRRRNERAREVSS
jgi:hypothetical protein